MHETTLALVVSGLIITGYIELIKKYSPGAIHPTPEKAVLKYLIARWNLTSSQQRSVSSLCERQMKGAVSVFSLVVIKV